MADNRKRRDNQADDTQDISSLLQKRNAILLSLKQHKVAIEQYNLAVEEYKSKNPDIDVEVLLSEQKGSLPIPGLVPNRELDKFINYAKEQGTKIPFEAMEMGILAAGRKDMQNGLAELLDSMKFDKPVCSECNEKMDNRGRSKKKS